MVFWSWFLRANFFHDFARSSPIGAEDKGGDIFLTHPGEFFPASGPIIKAGAQALRHFFDLLIGHRARPIFLGFSQVKSQPPPPHGVLGDVSLARVAPLPRLAGRRAAAISSIPAPASA